MIWSVLLLSVMALLGGVTTANQVGISGRVKQMKSCSCTCAFNSCKVIRDRDDCQLCAEEVKKGFTWQGGVCWIKIGPTSEGNCALLTFASLIDCDPFLGYTHYGGGNQNCWARFADKKGSRKKRSADGGSSSADAGKEIPLDTGDSTSGEKEEMEALLSIWDEW